MLVDGFYYEFFVIVNGEPDTFTFMEMKLSFVGWSFFESEIYAAMPPALLYESM